MKIWYRNSIHFRKVYLRALGSAYFVGMDFNPSEIGVEYSI
ncbi:hypothetical protein ACYE2N_08650 [Flavobacterium sp. MAHUQ-51]